MKPKFAKTTSIETAEFKPAELSRDPRESMTSQKSELFSTPSGNADVNPVSYAPQPSSSDPPIADKSASINYERSISNVDQPQELGAPNKWSVTPGGPVKDAHLSVDKEPVSRAETPNWQDPSNESFFD